MLSDAQVKQFETDGFLKGERVLTDAQVDELRGEVERVIADRDQPVQQPVLLHNFAKEPGKVVWQIVNICDASAPFAALVRNPQITAVVAQLTGAQQVRLWHDQI